MPILLLEDDTFTLREDATGVILLETLAPEFVAPDESTPIEDRGSVVAPPRRGEFVAPDNITNIIV